MLGAHVFKEFLGERRAANRLTVTEAAYVLLSAEDIVLVHRRAGGVRMAKVDDKVNAVLPSSMVEDLVVRLLREMMRSIGSATQPDSRL